MTAENPIPPIIPLGDAAVLVEFSEVLDLGANARIQQLATSIRSREMPWIRDVVPALGTLVLHFDPDQCARGFSPRNAAAKLINECQSGERPGKEEQPRRVEVPVCYAQELAPDLAEVAAHCGLDVEEVIRRHCASPHRVLMLGFVPGHPYIGGLDPALAMPRRATPRTKVISGSVAIANAQTVVYPFTTPGGWNIIGRTPLRMFDAGREPPTLLAPGDRVEFVPIDLRRFEELARAAERDRTR
jgi:KipI family sensor histidine kinase inhibitor